MIETLALAAILTATPPHQSAPQPALPARYTGIWHNPDDEDRRSCIVHRESRGDYRARNPRSSAQGAYQFLDRQWRDGLVWMMLDESKQTRDGLSDEIRELRDIPIAKWPPYFQDRAFWTAWRHGDGAHHWKYPPKPC